MLSPASVVSERRLIPEELGQQEKLALEKQRKRLKRKSQRERRKARMRKRNPEQRNPQVGERKLTRLREKPKWEGKEDRQV